MEFLKINEINKKVSKIGLGTQSFGSHRERDVRKTISKTFDEGINFLDTAWIYGKGRSEQYIGRNLKEYDREKIVIESKAGLRISDGVTVRDSREKVIRKQLKTSLKRLKTDYIDIFYIHWPDSHIAFEKTAETLEKLKEEGMILSIGLSNYTVDELKRYEKKGSIAALQNPYNIFERKVEEELLPYTRKRNVPVMAYRSLCQGLLTGKYQAGQLFCNHEVKKDDPKFKQPRFSQYLKAVEKLDRLAKENYDKTVLALSIRWIIDNKNIIALWGAWKPDYLDEINDIFGWNISKQKRKEIDIIVNDTIKDPVGPDFLAPELRNF